MAEKSPRTRFSLVKHADGTYGIECLLIIRKDINGRYPQFIEEKIGKSTLVSERFYLLIKDCIKDFKDVCVAVDDLNGTYSEVIRKCEETGDWKRFPFKKCQMVYHK